MSATIWKFPLSVTDGQTVMMPTGARCLSVQLQEHNGTLCVWAMVEPTLPTVERRFLMAGTGHPLPDIVAAGQARHLGTVQLDSGRLIFHVFEVPQERPQP